MPIPDFLNHGQTGVSNELALTELPRHHTHDIVTHILFQNALMGEFNEDNVRACLMKGADVLVTDNYMANNTLLLWIIGNTAINNIVQFLTTFKNFYQDAPEVFTTLLNQPDVVGKSPLLFAITKGWKHQTDYHTSRLRPKMSTAIEALVQFGADINQVDHAGNSPLHIAIMRRDYDAIRYLLEHGADASLKNKANLLPAQMLEFTYPEVTKYLRQSVHVYTMQSKAEFMQMYRPIAEFLESICPVQDRLNILGPRFNKNEDPVQIQANIAAAINDLHTLCKRNEHQSITEMQVMEVLQNHQLERPVLKAQLTEFVITINRENSMAKVFGYANRYWDAMCQFVMSLFGKDRQTMVTKTCTKFKQNLKDAFQIQFRSQEVLSRRINDAHVHTPAATFNARPSTA